MNPSSDKHVVQRFPTTPSGLTHPARCCCVCIEMTNSYQYAVYLIAMDSAKVLYSNGANDECYTPAYAVTPLLQFIPTGARIWCPFDNEKSQYVQIFSASGFSVTATHIDTGFDYFHEEPNDWDILISNPPFTRKKKIFERALSFQKPFALLMTNTWLNDAAPKLLFETRDLQLLMFDKRIKFGNQIQRGITFSSSYYCWNFLPKQIIMQRLKVT